MNKKNRKKYLDLIFISIIISFFLTSLAYIGIFNNINLKLTDNLYGYQNPLNEIIILEIDDKSIQEIGRWPWERNVYSNIITKLNNSKVIGIDVGFFEKSNNELYDKELENVLINSDNVVVAVQYLNFEKSENNNEIVGKEILKPIFDISNDKQGYINVIKDSDGVVRSANINVFGNYSSFSYQIYKKYYNVIYYNTSINNDIDDIKFNNDSKNNYNKINNNFESKNKYFKQYEQNKFLINYVNNPFSFKSYSLTDVLNKKIEPENFENKIILIGATSSNLHDDFLVPTSKGLNMPGVEIHANILQTMINNNTLKHQGIFSLFLSILISSIFISFISNKTKFWISFLIVLIMIIIWIFLSIFIFKYNLILNLIYIPIAILFTFTSVTSYNYITEEKKKKEIQTAFGKYVSPKIIDEIMLNPNKLKLGGERKEITIFFSDIASFTNLSENLNPEELVKFLNIYLTKMTDLVSKNEGIVDKYIGDAIMAFWGAPISHKNQVELACITSLEMMKVKNEISHELKLKNFKFDFRIGLNYGEAIVGNMGSNERFDYTLIGDNVNLASRLESINKQYRTNIIVSESVYNKTKNKFVFRELDLIKVKGKNIPVRIYELIDYIKNKKQYKEKLNLFNNGLKLYREQKFELAIEIFLKIKNKYNDLSSEIFIKRCKELQKEKLPKNWDGVYIMKTK